MNVILKILVFLTVFTGALAQDDIGRITPAQESIQFDESNFLESVWFSGQWLNGSQNIKILEDRCYLFNQTSNHVFNGSVSIQIMEQIYLTGNYSNNQQKQWETSPDMEGTVVRYKNTVKEWGIGFTFLLTGYEPIFLDDAESLNKPLQYPDTSFRPYANFSFGVNEINHSYNLIRKINPYTAGDRYYELKYISTNINVGTLVHIAGPLNLDISVGIKKSFFNPTEVSKQMSPWYETFEIKDTEFLFKSGITVIL